MPPPVSPVISVRARPGCREACLEGLTRNTHASVLGEPGCLRFDATTGPSDPDLFWVHEVFRDEEALQNTDGAHAFLPGSNRRPRWSWPGARKIIWALRS